MNRITLFIFVFLGFGVNLRANTDDTSIEFLLKKSTVVVAGMIEEEPMSVFSESGVIDYLIKIKDAKSLSGDAVPAKISVSASRFYDSEKDALPYLKKGQRCIFFLVLKPNYLPVYHTSDLWLAIQPYSAPMARRILALTK